MSWQPLPVLAEAQVNVAGPLQPAGRGLRPPVMDKFVPGLPSLLLNVTVNVWLPDPTTALIVPLGEGVPTMVLSEPAM